jgi:F-type H+-transporting ATPase subunit gamma
MATLKDVQNKIQAVKKTKQITKAMNMVAASRLRGAQQNMDGFRPYAAKFAEVLGSLAGRADEGTSPLLVPREAVEKIRIVLCTSDRGLCGGFNANLIERAETLMQEKAAGKVDFSFTCFGKKGRDWCRKAKQTIDSEHLGVVGAQFGFNVASTEGRRLVDGFLGGDFDEVYMVYAEFVSMARQLPMAKQLLPIPALEETMEEEAAADETGQFLAEHICEPSPQELLDDMLPRNVYAQIYSALLETSTSEHAARMMAMDNATKACNDMLDNLTRVYNKARQAAITGELMDIVGGAEALRG